MEDAADTKEIKQNLQSVWLMWTKRKVERERECVSVCVRVFMSACVRVESY